MAALLADSSAFQSNFQASFGHLTVAQLNWKPNPETWSVGECLDHLITTNRSYFAQLTAMSKGDKYESFWEKLPFLHDFWGKMLLKTVSEKVEKKAKSPQAFQPTRSTVPHNILEEYAKNHAELIALIVGTDQIDHERAMLTSPAASFVTYSLKNAVEILLTHEKRHFQQALAVTKTSEFPQNS